MTCPSSSMATYANEHFELYVPDKEIKSAILVENPVHINIDPVKKMDDFVKSILKDNQRGKGTSELISHDNVLEKVQNKIRDVMGPLSMWCMIENAVLSKTEDVTISLDTMKEFMEQTVLLVGQFSDTVP